MSEFFHKWLWPILHWLSSIHWTWSLFWLLWAVLLAPGIWFFWLGWKTRKDELVNTFRPTVACEYLRFYLPGTNAAEADAIDKLKNYYQSFFGARLFIIPFLIFSWTSGFAIYLSILSIHDWVVSWSLNSTVLPPEVVLALAGGYIWVMNDHVERSFRNNLRPVDLIWGSFRLIISPPIAYAFSKMGNEAFTYPLCVLLGTFPTGTVMTFARRFGVQKLGLEDGGEQGPKRLLVMPSMDITTAEAFNAEGIQNVHQLYYCDPVRLAFRTGYSIGYVFSTIGEAILTFYAEESIAVYRKNGLACAQECRSLFDELTGADGPGKNRAKAIVAAIATDSKTPPEGVEYLLEQVAVDPVTSILMKYLE